MGKVAIEGMQFYAHHGYYKEEQVLGGQYMVDVYIDLDLSLAGRSDELNNTLNYEAVHRLVKEEMAIEASLIEHVGQRILDRIKKGHPEATHTLVRVSKMNPPIKGTVDRVFIELSA